MKQNARIPAAAGAALLAAALFGASTPLAKLLLGQMTPSVLAGLLYLGSGIGLTLLRLWRDRGWRDSGMARGDWLWLAGAIALGGSVGPLLLMFALTRTPATTASLLLNLEGVFTALLAWIVFRENADRRVVLGMAAIVAGGVVLAWPSAWSTGSTSGALLVALACLAWAFDNNLTRRVAVADPLFTAAAKGWIAGGVNLAIGWSSGAEAAHASGVGGALLVGFFGYGASLVLFILALRGLGAARTGAYFSTAPFIGAALSIALLGEPVDAAFGIAAALMAAGVWLHLTERHEHTHTHEAQSHTHTHRHDLHHQHVHDFPWDGSEPHTHPHRHEPVTHTHAHYPDVHHRHEH